LQIIWKKFKAGACGAYVRLLIRLVERTAELEQRATQLARLTSELTLAEQRQRQRIAVWTIPTK
jgi:hypothetical protein